MATTTTQDEQNILDDLEKLGYITATQTDVGIAKQAFFDDFIDKNASKPINQIDDASFAKVVTRIVGATKLIIANPDRYKMDENNPIFNQYLAAEMVPGMLFRTGITTKIINNNKIKSAFQWAATGLKNTSIDNDSIKGAKQSVETAEDALKKVDTAAEALQEAKKLKAPANIIKDLRADYKATTIEAHNITAKATAGITEAQELAKKAANEATTDVRKANKEVKNLTEQINIAEKNLKTLQETSNNAQKLAEKAKSGGAAAQSTKQFAEDAAKATTEAKTTLTQLNEKLETANTTATDAKSRSADARSNKKALNETAEALADNAKTLQSHVKSSGAQADIKKAANAAATSTPKADTPTIDTTKNAQSETKAPAPDADVKAPKLQTPDAKAAMVISDTTSGMKGAGRWMANGAATLGRGGGRLALSIGKGFVRGLPVIGGVIAGHEVAGLENNAQAAEDAGLIDSTAYNLLMAEYGAHVTQSAIDPTLFGGEIITKTAMYQITKQNNIDPAMALLLTPAFMANLVSGGPSFMKTDLIEMQERYGDDNIDKLFDNIADKHNLPQVIDIRDKDGNPYDAVSIGIALRDPDFARKIREQLVDGKDDVATEEIDRGLAAMQLVNNAAALTDQAIYEYSLKNNGNGPDDKPIPLNVTRMMYKAATDSTMGFNGTLDLSEMEKLRIMVLDKTDPDSIERARHMTEMYDMVENLPDDHDEELEADNDDILNFRTKYSSEREGYNKTVKEYDERQKAEEEARIKTEEQLQKEAAAEQAKLEKQKEPEKNADNKADKEKPVVEEKTTTTIKDDPAYNTMVLLKAFIEEHGDKFPDAINDPVMLLTIADIETGGSFDPTAINKTELEKNSQDRVSTGLMQVIERTAATLHGRGYNDKDPKNLLDAETSLYFAAATLQDQKNIRPDENEEWNVRAYNGGYDNTDSKTEEYWEKYKAAYDHNKARWDAFNDPSKKWDIGTNTVDSAKNKKGNVDQSADKKGDGNANETAEIATYNLHIDPKTGAFSVTGDTDAFIKDLTSGDPADRVRLLEMFLYGVNAYLKSDPKHTVGDIHDSVHDAVGIDGFTDDLKHKFHEPLNEIERSRNGLNREFTKKTDPDRAISTTADPDIKQRNFDYTRSIWDNEENDQINDKSLREDYQTMLANNIKAGVTTADKGLFHITETGRVIFVVRVAVDNNANMKVDDADKRSLRVYDFTDERDTIRGLSNVPLSIENQNHMKAALEEATDKSLGVVQRIESKEADGFYYLLHKKGETYLVTDDFYTDNKAIIKSAAKNSPANRVSGDLKLHKAGEKHVELTDLDHSTTEKLSNKFKGAGLERLDDEVTDKTIVLDNKHDTAPSL